MIGLKEFLDKVFDKSDELLEQVREFTEKYGSLDNIKNTKIALPLQTPLIQLVVNEINGKLDDMIKKIDSLWNNYTYIELFIEINETIALYDEEIRNKIEQIRKRLNKIIEKIRHITDSKTDLDKLEDNLDKLSRIHSPLSEYHSLTRILKDIDYHLYNILAKILSSEEYYVYMEIQKYLISSGKDRLEFSDQFFRDLIKNNKIEILVSLCEKRFLICDIKL